MSDEPSNNSAPLSVDDQIKIYNVFREYVKRENDNIHNRLSAILTIHGFLYATYGFTLQKKAEIIQKIYCGLMPEMLDMHKLQHETVFQLNLFLVCIAMLGIAISLIGLRSIHAAKMAANNVWEIFNIQYNPSKLPREMVPSSLPEPKANELWNIGNCSPCRISP